MTATSVVPTLRYRDVPAAVDWLCKAFGFEKHLVVAGEGSTIHYAQLTLGSGMVMLGPVQDSAFDKLMVQPDEIGGAETQICYFFVDDAKVHYARAKAAGANIVLDIENEGQGGRGYSCRDPEGHIWNFGTFNPWERQSVRGPRGAGKGKRRTGKVRSTASGALWLMAIALIAAAAVMYTPALQVLSELAHAAIAGTAPDADTAREELTRERRAREIAERAVKEAREQLARERSARADSEQAANSARQQLAGERAAKDAAERGAKAAREQLGQARAASDAAERSAQEAREQLKQLQAAVEAAGNAPQAADELKEARVRLEAAEQATKRAQEAKQVAERAALEAREQAAKAQQAKQVAERATKEAQAQAARERNARANAERAAARRPSSYGPTTE